MGLSHFICAMRISTAPASGDADRLYTIKLTVYVFFELSFAPKRNDLDRLRHCCYIVVLDRLYTFKLTIYLFF